VRHATLQPAAPPTRRQPAGAAVRQGSPVLQLWATSPSGWATRTGPLGLMAKSASRAAAPLGLWPWGEGRPNAGLIFSVFCIGLNNCRNSIKFLKYIENEIQLIKYKIIFYRILLSRSL
jgi:hypothetical protein